MQHVIELDSVSKIFGAGATEVQAVRNVNLKIQRGDFTALVGPSGSGKSTLLNLIGGLDPATSGRISLAGGNLATMTGRVLSDFRRDHIGFIFQSFNLIPVLSVAENVEYVLLLQGVAKEERRRRVLKVLDDLAIADKVDSFPSELSGGQQQRVAVARAIVSKPDIILADEPTANLDSKMSVELVTMMRDLNKTHQTTFLFSTHDEVIMRLATKVISLQDGRIVDDV